MANTIEILSELRSNYNCFASVDEPYYQALTEAIAAIKAERKGHWIKREFLMPLSDSSKIGYECTECLTHWDVPTSYCPYCGARMVD